ncbi:MAG: hypothetical protein ACLPYY_19965 [Acidimicrobiales bacterium]
MRGKTGRRRQLAFPVAPAVMVALGALVVASCGSSPSTPRAGTPTTHHAAPAPASAPPTTTTAPPASTLPPVSTSGPFQVGAAIALPFSADRVTAAESPDGAVFAAPQDPTSPSPAIAWVVDANGPAAIAEHVPTGIAALAADSSNFYVATYQTVFAYGRASGNQDGQWTMPSVQAANSSDDGLVALAAAGGDVFVSVTQGDTVSVYRIDPTSSSAPHLLLRGLGDAVGSDGSVYYESADHHLDVLRPNGATATGPALAATPNGLGGGVQYLDVVAGGAVWVSEPAGQGLDAAYTTYDVATLHVLGTYSGSVTSSIVDSAAGPLVLEAAGTNAACPAAAQAPTACVFRIDVHGTVSDPVGVGSAVNLLGPGPAVVVSDTSTGQFDLVRLS